ncbi:Alpha/beta hydrolase domain-containing protein 17C [Thelohanellus kitauei]|uniref:Protein ABHD13 n=1 Tax=Thelohanellus kitauei TaxID=669202 RepID=A0A0C2IIR9_THEKT|nr:Alpha/beta hydrolase domain-containing protein 17C [Thelohanellus kitauei]
MNFAECVGLFCCPPWLPSIINKLSFKPPENPSYVMSLKSDGRVTFSFTGSENMLEPIPPYIIIRSYLVDCRKDKIAMVHIRTPAEPGYTILYSHGNACDLGHTFGLLITMCQILRCDVVVYDYNGYGSSTGKPNENGMRHNIECVYSYMISNLKIKPENVIVFGQSIGSVAALHLAANQMVAGVILQSALASGFRLVFPGFSRTWCCDPFQK